MPKQEDTADHDRKWNQNTKLKQIENDIGIVYTLRNSAAHRIRDRPFMHENFKQIVDSLFNIIFLTIEKLYVVKI